MKKAIGKISETKSQFFENISKTDRLLISLLARLIKKKKKKEKTQINKTEKGKVITDNKEIQRIIKHHYEQLYANKVDKLEEMDEFYEKYNVSRVNQEEIEKNEHTNHKH